MLRYAVALSGALVVAGCGRKEEAKERGAVTKTIVVREGPGRQTARRGPGARGGKAGARDVADGLASQPERLVLGATLKKKNYDLSLTGPAKLANKAKGTYEVVLIPRAPYKVNKLYPHRLTFGKVPSGLAVSPKILEKKDAAVFEPHKLVFRFEVTAQQEGPAVLEGLLKFSVCTPKFCETPKARILVPLNGATVKAEPPKGETGGAPSSI